jgi:hypothetical protein
MVSSLLRIKRKGRHCSGAAQSSQSPEAPPPSKVPPSPETSLLLLLLLSELPLSLLLKAKAGFNQFAGNLTKSAQSYAI